MTAVIYARYSSDSQREASIEGQLRDCKDYAEKNGITVVGTYIDRAYSAKTDDRPDFQRMIKDSGKKIFDVVLVWKLDRFARNRFDAVNYKYQLEKNGVHLVSAMEPISQGPEGIMVESMLIGMAEYYSAELALKVARGERENALQCKYNGGVVPLGFTIGKEDRLYHIDPETAPIVQEIFTRYADGEPAEKIAASLNERGLRTRTGKPFVILALHVRLVGVAERAELCNHQILQTGCVELYLCTTERQRLKPILEVVRKIINIGFHIRVDVVLAK